MKFKENKLSWTDDRIGLLKRMWKEGKSAADIAKALGKGVTRNAVIGKAHRMGLSGRPSPITAVPKKAETKEVSKKSSAPAGKKDAPKEAKLPPGKKGAAPAAPLAKNMPPPRDMEELKRIEKEQIPPGGGVALIDLTERMCKWPIGDPREPEFTFCGRGIRPGTPYCPDHAATAYQSSSRRGPAVVVAAAPVANEDKETEAEDGDDDDEELETAG
jgi:GcrA cell cycle regulator